MISLIAVNSGHLLHVTGTLLSQILQLMLLQSFESCCLEPPDARLKLQRDTSVYWTVIVKTKLQTSAILEPDRYGVQPI